jgi:hypothetical protein
MAGRPRTRRARELTAQAVTILRGSGSAWPLDELLAAVAPDAEPAVLRIARRQLVGHPCVVGDERGRVHFWSPRERNGRAA